ncbi:DMT family transporter [Undibacterium sp. RuRC25W]|uniref:DMT family transporter n=1 Tax=Undibacterium sp. RuRC25W TaxID=3413047 RepID=UPI003BF3F415
MLYSMWMVVAGFCFALMGVLIKHVSDTLAVPDVLFYRSLINLIMIVFLMRQKGVAFSTSVPLLHVRRAMTGNLSLICMFFSIAHLPIATATTLNYTNPIFLALLSIFLFKEKPTWLVYVAIFIGFIGIVTILHPSFSPNQYLGGLAGLTSGLLTALAYYSVGVLVQNGESELRVVFYFSLTGVVMSLLWLMGTGFSHVDPSNFPTIIGFGTLGSLGQLCMTRAYGRGKALTTSALSYTTVIFSALLSWLMLKDTLPGSTILGIALIIIGGVLSMLFNSDRRKVS